MHDERVTPLSRMVDKLAFHAVLPDGDRAALLDLPHVLRRFDSGSLLVREGDAPSLCRVLLTGYAYRHKISSEGRRQIVSIHIPGEILDLQHLYLEVADHNVQTLTECMVATIPGDAVRALAHDRPAISHAFFIGVLIEGSIFREWLLNIGRRDARSRTAHFLCEFAARLDKQGLNPGQPYDLPMTQEQLGDALGLTAVHVNRVLKSLSTDGLIVRHKRGISFPRWNLLKQESDFTSHYLHLGRQI